MATGVLADNKEPVDVVLNDGLNAQPAANHTQKYKAILKSFMTCRQEGGL
jgi:hypothetical protein